MFFYKVEGHMLKLSSFGRGKKFRPKKSLTSLLHAALQLISKLIKVILQCIILMKKFCRFCLSWSDVFALVV